MTNKAKEKAMKYLNEHYYLIKGLMQDGEVKRWDVEHIKSAIDIALQEQAKEIIEMIDMIPVPESMKGNPKVIWTFAEVNRVIREKYGVKEEGK